MHAWAAQKPRRKVDRYGRKVSQKKDRVDRLVYAYKHAGSAMFVTSLTTAASFFSNVSVVLTWGGGVVPASVWWKAGLTCRL